MPRKPRQRPKKYGKSYGLTSKLTVGQFLVKMFEAQYTKRLSDEQLTEILADEFPRGPNYRPRISFYRNIYNRGEWACQNGQRPDLQCYRYSGQGQIIERSPGPAPSFLRKGEKKIEKLKDDLWDRDPTIHGKMDKLCKNLPTRQGKKYRETHPEDPVSSTYRKKKKS